MPIAVYVLGLGIFALGTTEFMISGLLPEIATDMGVSIPSAGLLVSAFAFGMLAGAPAMAVLTLRLPRKVTLLAALGVFTAGQVLGAVAPSYGTLMVARVVTAVATGAFWAVGGVVATRLVAPERRARALAVMVGGLTVANVVGVPLGTVIGDALGWRAGFWAVGALAAVAFAGVAAFVPRASGARSAQAVQAPEARPDLRAEVRVFASARIWAALASTAVVSAAIFGVFSYMAPLVTDVAGLPSGLVPVVLMVFGVGGVLGVAVGGRVADAYPFRTLYWGAGGLAVALALLGAFGWVPWAVLVLTGVFGVAGFVINPALNGRVIGLAGDAPTLAASSSVSAFNTGNMIGPWLGGLVINGAGTAAVPWLGAGLAALSAGAVTVSVTLERRHARTAVPAAAGVPRGDSARV